MKHKLFRCVNKREEEMKGVSVLTIEVHLNQFMGDIH